MPPVTGEAAGISPPSGRRQVPALPMSGRFRETKNARRLRRSPPGQAVLPWKVCPPLRADCRKAPWRILPMRPIWQVWRRMQPPPEWMAWPQLFLKTVRRMRERLQPEAETRAEKAFPAASAVRGARRGTSRRAASARAGKAVLPGSVPAAFPGEEAAGTAIFTVLRSGLTIRM